MKGVMNCDGWLGLVKRIPFLVSMTRHSAREVIQTKRNNNVVAVPREESMNTKKKFRLGWCSRILFLAALLCLCLQLAIVATDQHSRPITTGVHRPSNYTATSTRRIVYVHIGKTGGEFIKSQLAIICKTRKNPKVKQTCLDSFATPQEATTALSRQTGGYLHVHTLFPRNAVAWASHYLFSIRHPLHRLVSWYVYNHPQSCDPRESNSPSCKSSDWKTQFFECFPTLEALGRGHISKKAGNCAQVLWNGWYGRLSNVKEPNHLYWNYQVSETDSYSLIDATG